MREKTRHTRWYAVRDCLGRGVVPLHVLRVFKGTYDSKSDKYVDVTWADKFSGGTPFTKTQASKIADELNCCADNVIYTIYPDKVSKPMVTEEEKYHQWRIKSVVDTGDVTLNPYSFCPQHKVTLEVTICCDAQHDGHLWTEAGLEDAERKLTWVIGEAIKPHLARAIKEMDPYAAHYEIKDGKFVP